jgi:hypothetical protein
MKRHSIILSQKKEEPHFEGRLGVYRKMYRKLA